MDVRVALVCQEGEARRAYISAVQTIGAHVDTASSFSELHKLFCENSYNGVMVDLKAKLKASQNEKDLIQDLLEQFPMSQLKFEEKTGTVRSLNFGRASDSQTVEAFINEECRLFPARPIRASARKKIYFNAIISKTGDFSEAGSTRTVTMNVSQGGCFIYSTDHWEIGDKVMIILKGLDDQKPISGEVRWQISWGETMQIPGIGVKFEDISAGQFAEICNRCTS